MPSPATSSNLFSDLEPAPAPPPVKQPGQFTEADKFAMMYDLLRRKIAALNAGAITQAQYDETDRMINRKIAEQDIPMRAFVVYCILQETPDYPVLRGDEAPF